MLCSVTNQLQTKEHNIHPGSNPIDRGSVLWMNSMRAITAHKGLSNTYNELSADRNNQIFISAIPKQGVNCIFYFLYFLYETETIGPTGLKKNGITWYLFLV